MTGRKTTLWCAWSSILSCLLPLICGCQHAVGTKTTELENRRIFRELSRIAIQPDVNQPLPETYTAPPKVVPSEEGMKVYYFTRHHSPEILAKLIKEQLGFLVSQNPATNQLVIRCNDERQSRFLLEFLTEVDVPPIQVRVDCLISEIFADLTIDFETQALIQDLLGEAIGIESLLPGASIRAEGRNAMGLKAMLSRKKFDATIDLLESRGYAKVLMHPILEVVNGHTARIQIKERIPTPEKILSGNTVIDTVKYQDIIDFLEVKVQLYSDGTIGLRTSAGISSKSPDGVEQTPVLTERQIDNSENRLKRGHSLVIGGILKKERISVVRTIPGLKHIPLIGTAFSGRDFEDRVKEIMFILTPTISTNGMEYKQAVNIVQQKLEGQAPSFCNLSANN